MLTPSSFLTRLCLPIMTLLMVLLALGPFLHAHYGSSRLQGFHVDGLGQLGAVHERFDFTVLTQDAEEESAALGVTTSHARQSFGDFDDAPTNLLALVFVWLTALVLCIPPHWHRTRHACTPERTYASGLPPPALAPPTSCI